MRNLRQNLTTFFISTLAVISSLSLAIGCVTAAPQDGATQAAPAAETISLRPKFVVGQVTVYEFTASVKANQAIDELEISNKTASHLIMRLEVAAVDEETGQATINITYDRIALSGENSMSGTSYAFDSGGPPMENKDFKVAAVLNRLKGSTLNATVNKLGQVLSVTGHEAALAAMQRNEILAGRIGEFNQAGLKQVLEGFWRVGEDEIPRLVGKDWTEAQDMEMASVGTLTFATIFDLKEADQDTAHLEITLDVTLELLKDIEAANEVAGAEDEQADDGTIEGAEDPDNLVLNHEAKDNAEQQAFQESLPAAESAELSAEKRPGKLLWDRQRNELIERETYLYFSLEIEQFEIFSQAMQTSFSLYDVTSKWKRIATE